MTELQFHVRGTPVPKGSKRWLPNGGMIEASATTLGPWRESIAWQALKAARQQHWTKTSGPIRITQTFLFQRPKSVTPKKRLWPIVKPDIDKILRALLDAIGDSGAVWVDDAQVVVSHEEKRYALPGEAPGVHVRIEAL